MASLRDVDADGVISPSTYPHRPVRGWLNARFFHHLDGFINWTLRHQKSALYADLPDTVVEIGPGVGSNLSYYEPGTRLVAIEPNPKMHSLLRRNAARRRVQLDLRADTGEATGLPDDSADVVITSLVLCTVADPDAVLTEIHRILRPGGRYLFLEHVAARTPTLRAFQHLIGRPWSCAFEGCQLDRQTHTAVVRCFPDAQVTHYTARSPFVPVNPQIIGVASKSLSASNASSGSCQL